MPTAVNRMSPAAPAAAPVPAAAAEPAAAPVPAAPAGSAAPPRRALPDRPSPDGRRQAGTEGRDAGARRLPQQAGDLREEPGNRGPARWLKAWRADRGQHSAARAQARARVPVGPGERLLATARRAGGQLAVATDRALYHDSGHCWQRLGWDEVSEVRWDERQQVLTLTTLAPAARTVLRLASGWNLPAVARERVTWSKLVDRRVRLGERGGARLVARRGGDGGSVTWLVVLDGGVDPADPAIRIALESALAELRAATGV